MTGSQTASSAETIDAVLLDAGGVLILPDPAVIRAVLVPFGVHPTDTVLARAHYAGMAARETAAERLWAAYRRAYVQVCGVGEQVEQAAAALDAAAPEWIFPTAEARVQLARLAELGVALAVVSNAAGRVEWQLGVAGVCQVGDGLGVSVRKVIDSHLVGVRKPDPEIFQLGLDAVDTPAERTVMVGDYATADVCGAERAGIRAVHIDPHGDCRTPHAGPDVPGLAAVVDLVRRHRP